MRIRHGLVCQAMLLALLSLAHMAGAQIAPAQSARTVQLRKQVPGDFMYRFVSASTADSPPAPLPAASGADSMIALALPAGFQPKDTQLVILDMNKGNAARIPLASAGPLSLTEGSFKLVQTLYVPVQSGGKAVIGAEVTLSDSNKKIIANVVLMAADAGVARFTDVPLDKPVTVTVNYGSNPPKIQTDTLSLNHPADGAHWPAIVLDWPDVKTIAGPAAAPAVTGAPGAPAPPALPATAPPLPASGSEGNGGGFFNQLASMLVSIVFVCAIGYGLWWAFTTGRVKQFMEKAGIQTEPMVSSTASAANPFAKPERTPVQPITDGTADPLAGGIPGAFSPPVSAGPRLVVKAGTYLGSVFPLTSATADVGRDPTNAIPLPQDTVASRHHATLQVAGGQVALVDNASSNGTFVNGARIPSQTPRPLQNGDEIQIGTTRFRFEA